MTIDTEQIAIEVGQEVRVKAHVEIDNDLYKRFMRMQGPGESFSDALERLVVMAEERRV